MSSTLYSQEYKRENLGNLVRRTLEMEPNAVYGGVYFNPMFVQELASSLPQLENLQFKFIKTEIETSAGTLVEGSIRAPVGSELKLGSLLLSGKDVKILKELVTLERVVEFIENHAQT